MVNQRGTCRHRNGQRDVSFGKVSHQIGRDTAWTRSNLDDSCGDRWLEIERPGKTESQQRHDGELKKDSDEHGSWHLENSSEIRDRQG